MTFDFHPEAEAEFIQAIAFYDEAESSLGERERGGDTSPISGPLRGRQERRQVSIE